MKQIFIILAFATQLFTALPTAFGQEFIRGNMGEYFCDTSIVRVKTNESVLVYYSREGCSAFLLVNPMSINVPVVFLVPYYVNDFEIIDNKVYFCGYKLNNWQKKAIFGSFLLTSFPYCTFSYCVLDTCTELRKLDVYRVDVGPEFDVHLAMTGTTGTRSDVLVDRVMSSNFPYMYFPCNVYFSNDETESFDDIAVTDKYIVVSSRRKIQGNINVDFWQFSKPYLTGIPYLHMPLHRFRFGSPAAESPVFLEHSNADDYAAVYKESGFSRMVILQLSAPNTVNNCIEILGDTSQIVFPMEIKYDKGSMVYDILASNEYHQQSKMDIYHITTNVVNHLAAFGEGTRYTDYLLWSIDPSKWYGRFYASGGYGVHPMLFRYKYDQWKTCPDYFQYHYDIGKPQGIYEEDAIEYYSFKLEMDKIETGIEYIQFNPRCEEKNK